MGGCPLGCSPGRGFHGAAPPERGFVADAESQPRVWERAPPRALSLGRPSRALTTTFTRSASPPAFLLPSPPRSTDAAAGPRVSAAAPAPPPDLATLLRWSSRCARARVMSPMAWTLPAPAGVGQLVSPLRRTETVPHRPRRAVAADAARRGARRGLPLRVAVGMKASPDARVAAATSSSAAAAAASTHAAVAAAGTTVAAGVAAAGIRTVALAGKDGCGKTALAAALLSLAAAKRGGGQGVDGGAPEEVAHGMTLHNHVYCAEREGDYRGTDGAVLRWGRASGPVERMSDRSRAGCRFLFSNPFCVVDQRA